LSEILESTL